jgi:hypothetical protein
MDSKKKKKKKKKKKTDPGMGFEQNTEHLTDLIKTHLTAI